jgi:cation diffusion facilitator CzcD-associated flavoprotein CzcO
MPITADFDAVIVGAGFSGMLALYRLRAIGLSVRVIEAGDGVGGTWYWNRYPGARCDVESIDYSYQFSEQLQQEWEWTERYASQPEILRYLNHVADRFDQRRDIQLATRVDAAHYDEERARWTVRTDDGSEFSAKWLLMASGCLSCPNKPPLPGEAQFYGKIYHTGQWPPEGVVFTGQRVGVIGTGSSGVQAIPIIAEQAAHLIVFQRTASYCAPAHNRPLDPAALQRIKAEYPAFRVRSNAEKGGAQFNSSTARALDTQPAQRDRIYEARWAVGGLHFQAAFADLFVNVEANETAAEFVRGKIRSIVKNPDTAAALIPTHLIGCKRLCVDTDYYETFNRDNVTLVDVRHAPIEEITETGLRTRHASYDLDIIVFATGYDAMTGALDAIDIRGRDGVALKEAWRAGPRTYLGVSTAGFPNLFIIAGPGSPSVLTNMVASIEQHVEWIARCIARQETSDVVAFEASEDAQDEWVNAVNVIADHTVFSGCNSWYLGANVPGKTRVFMPYAGGLPAYRQKCEEVAAAGYEGFIVRRSSIDASLSYAKGASPEKR